MDLISLLNNFLTYFNNVMFSSRPTNTTVCTGSKWWRVWHALVTKKTLCITREKRKRVEKDLQEFIERHKKNQREKRLQTPPPSVRHQDVSSKLLDTTTLESGRNRSTDTTAVDTASGVLRAGVRDQRTVYQRICLLWSTQLWSLDLWDRSMNEE